MFIRQLIGLSLLLISLSLPLTLAQTPAQPDTQTPPPGVNIIINSKLVRFAAQAEISEWRLEVFNQRGESVFDSGLVSSPTLDWPLYNQKGEAVESGLYAYILTLKIPNSDSPRAQRGHIILDRAGSSSDQIWVTSRNGTGIGGDSGAPQLTVTGSSESVIGGARVTTENERPAPQRASDGRALEEQGRNDPADTQPKPTNALNIAGTGTTGLLSKWLDGPNGVLGDSVVSESNGKIGIGTTNPLRTLQIGPSVDAAFTFEPADASPNAGYVRFGDRTGWKLHFGRSRESSRLNGAPLNTGTTGVLMTLQDNGNVGIGTMAPEAQLHVFGQSGRVKAQAAPPNDTTQDNAAFVLANRGAGGAPYTWVLATAAVGGGFGINPNALEIWEYPQDATPGCCLPRLRILPSGNQGSAPSPVTIMENGGLQTRMLQILGGSDLAEPFEVGGAETAQPGMVVAIDPEQPGRLRLADKAYDRTVVGIVSGANGIKPGLTMKQEGTLANGSLPVALTGRVYCWADASNGPIEPGDLLTTSNTPGHAMKVTNNAEAQGAIIGKAMTGLKERKGLVMVLVTLQ